MKILMVTMIMQIGGAETHISELCRELMRCGHDITLVSAGGAYADALEEAGIRHITLPLNSKKPSAVLKAYLGLSKLLKREYFDIVHSHARIPSFILHLLQKKYDFRLVTTAHLNFKVNSLWRRLSCWGEKTIAVSSDIRDYLVDSYDLPPENISLTINGIDHTKFSRDADHSSIVEEFHLSENAKRIVYVSRLDPDRSAPAFQLIEIAEKLSASFPSIEILIVGSGGDLEKLSRLASKANEKLDRRAVIMCGGRTDIYKFTAAADIVVAVSRAALEAMSAEKNVILAGNQGYMGIFTEDKLQAALDNNFCCRGFEMSSSTALLRDTLELLSRDSASLEATGKINREIIKKYYSVERMAKDYLDVYASLESADFRHGDIVICGYYGFGNLGDDALLSAIISSLRESLLAPRITVLAHRGSNPAPKCKNIKYVSRSNPIAVIGALRRAKLLIFGGGTLLQDTTSRKSLFYYLSIIRLAKLFKNKIYIYANGVGPLYHRLDQRATVKRIRCADIISVRDNDSAAFLKQLGYTGKVYVSADPAYLTSPHNEKELTLPSGEFAVISLRECIGRIAREYDTASAEAELAAALRQLNSRHGIIPIFVPMQSSRDAAICRRVMTAADIPEAFIFELNESSDALDALLTSEHVHFAIGMRLHMLIFASRAALPSLALSYDVKIDSLMRTLEQTAILHITSLKAEDIVKEAEDLLNCEASLRCELREHAESMTALAREDVTRACELLKKKPHKCGGKK